MRESRNYFAVLTIGICLPGCIVVPQNSYQPLYPSASVTDNYAPAAPPPQPQYQPAPELVYAPPPPEVVTVYQDDLSPYGHWIVYPRYGRCWVPNSVASGWQPYTVGHWVYTNDGNCCWVSEGNEVAWGPTVYHYGQWSYTPDYGWVWIPGLVWAPAWVSWREGDGYCGWAPLPPEACAQPQVTYVVADQYCPPERYVYVQEGFISDGRVDQRIVRNNTTIIRNTTNITNITVVNNRVINGGVSADRIQRVTGRTVQRTAVMDASSPEEARQLAARGEPVHYSNAAISHQIQIQNQRQAQLQTQLQRDKQVGDEKKLELNNQVQTDRQLQQDQQAAHQQQEQLDKQIAQQKQADRDKEAELRKQEAQDKQIAHQQQVDQTRQAAQDKAAAHAQQVEAQRQAERDRQAAQERQPQQDQAQQDNARNGHDNGQHAPAPQKAKAKPKLDQPQGNTPPPQ